MRPLEFVLLAAAGLGVVWAVSPWRHRRGAAAIVVIVGWAALLGQAGTERLRWQIVPLQAALVLLTIAGVTVLVRGRVVPAQRLLGGAAGVLALLGAAAAWALPVLVLPEPSGPAPVGTVTATLTDAGRLERYGPMPGEPRQIVAQVWYPAHPATPRTTHPLVGGLDGFGAAAAHELGVPAFTASHLDLIRSHTTPAAEPAPADEARPLVIYSHGWSGFRRIQSNLLELLASHGYVVVGIDHTFGSLATVFPDGRVAALDADALPTDVTAEAYEAASEQLVATFAGDIDLILDEVANGAVPALRDDVDLDRVAFIGHSTGGGAAVLACALSRRCGAVVAYDPWVEPVPDDVIGAGLHVPLLSIRSQEWADTPNDKRLRRLHAATEAAEGRVEIEGALHRDFTVVPLLSPLAPALGWSGSTPVERTHEITQEWTLRFLDHHLRGRGRDPLAVPPAFPESEVARASG